MKLLKVGIKHDDATAKPSSRVPFISFFRLMLATNTPRPPLNTKRFMQISYLNNRSKSHRRKAEAKGYVMFAIQNIKTPTYIREKDAKRKDELVV